MIRVFGFCFVGRFKRRNAKQAVTLVWRYFKLFHTARLSSAGLSDLGSDSIMTIQNQAACVKSYFVAEKELFCSASPHGLVLLFLVQLVLDVVVYLF